MSDVCVGVCGLEEMQNRDISIPACSVFSVKHNDRFTQTSREECFIDSLIIEFHLEDRFINDIIERVDWLPAFSCKTPSLTSLLTRFNYRWRERERGGRIFLL